MTEPTVTITAAPMSLDELLAVARGAPVSLAPDALERIDRSRAVIDELATGESPVYGVTTALGHGKDTRISAGPVSAYQEALVLLHDGAFGEPLPTEVVRAATAARVNGFARGGSGASRSAVEILVALLNAGVHPVVPRIGSVGASDLLHMASIAAVAIGAGQAEHRGEIVDGAEALRRAGLAPATLSPKDGLALVAANGMAIGHGALVVDHAERVADLADLAAAVSLEAICGNPSVLDPDVAHAKQIEGQRKAAEHMRAFLGGSHLFDPGGPLSVQDPLSFRVAPQVHGALRELLGFARQAVLTELNAVDDNPLVGADGRVLHNGNFHAALLALAFEALRPALAHVGLLSDRRSDHHTRLSWADPEMFGPERIDETLASSRGAMLRYAGAARVAELRQLAAPATLDIPPLDLAVEDHGTAAPLTVQRTADALDALEDVLAVELIQARIALRHQRAEFVRRLGAGTGAALKAIDAVLASVPPGRPAAALHAAVRNAGPALVKAGEEAARPEPRPTPPAR